MSTDQGCLICDTPVTAQKSWTGDKINHETTSFFIVRKLLQVSYSTCVDLFQKEGDPSRWCPCCEKCFSLAKEAKEICSQVAKLESCYKRVKESLEFEIWKCKRRDNVSLQFSQRTNTAVIQLLRKEIVGRLTEEESFFYTDIKKEVQIKLDNNADSPWDLEQIENDMQEAEESNIFMNDNSSVDCSDLNRSSISPDCNDGVLKLSKRNLRSLNRKPEIPIPTLPSTDNTKTFPCGFCKKVATTKNKIKVHEKRNHGVNHKFDCEDCGKVYNFHDNLRIHYKKCPGGSVASNKLADNHSMLKLQVSSLTAVENLNEETTSESFILSTNKGELSCQHCSKSFRTLEQRHVHENAVHGANHKFGCKFCSETFATKQLLRLHFCKCRKTESVNGTKSKLKCEFCTDMFRTVDGVNRHILRTHKELLTPVNCEHCGKKFPHKPSLDAHVKRIHDISETSGSVCNYCRKAFPTDLKLRFHMLRHHKDKPHPHPYECPQCGFISSSLNALKMHIDTVHEKLRSHLCEQCPKTFTRRQYLKSHLVKEHNVVFGQECDNLKCKLCDKVFSTAAYHRVHVRTVHERKFRFFCPICKLGVVSKSGMKSHIRTAHSNEKREICEICGKGFPERGRLNRHMQRHSDERCCKCQFCGKGFTTNEGKRRHETIHKSEKPVQCELCPKIFYSGSDLSTHKWYTHQGRKSKNPPKKIVDQEIIEKVIQNETFNLNDQIVPPIHSQLSGDS